MAIDAPITETPESVQTITPTPNNAAPETILSATKPARKPKVLAGLILIALVVCSLGGWFIWQVYHAPTSGTADPYALSYSYLTYKSGGKIPVFYVATPAGKVIAHAAIPSSATDSTVYARNKTGLIVDNSSPNTDPTARPSSSYVYVGFDGSTKPLSSQVGKALADGVDNAALDGASLVVYSACDSSTSQCTLNSINLDTGAVTTYLTERGIDTIADAADPFSILGVSGDIVYYTHASNFNAPDELDVYSMTTKKIVHTFKLQAGAQFPPVLSNNYHYAVYDDGKGYSADPQASVYILDLTNGRTTSFSIKEQGGVTPAYQNAFWWSPDDSSIVFTSPIKAPTTSTPPMSINLYNLHTGRVSTVLTFGDPQYNYATIMGWLSNDQLFYSVAKTTYANDFAPPYSPGVAYAGVNVKTGDDVQNPVDLKYTVVTPEPKL